MNWTSNFWLTDANRLERKRWEDLNRITEQWCPIKIVQTLRNWCFNNTNPVPVTTNKPWVPCSTAKLVLIVLLLPCYMLNRVTLLVEHVIDTTPLPPGLSKFPVSLEWINTQCRTSGLVWIREDYGCCAVAFRKCLSVYSWMCCSASDSSHASVIKAEGMSSLWTLPNHNPLAWRGVGRGEERRGWKDGLKVQYTETDVWHLAELFGLIWPSFLLLVYYSGKFPPAPIIAASSTLYTSSTYTMCIKIPGNPCFSEWR